MRASLAPAVPASMPTAWQQWGADGVRVSRLRMGLLFFDVLEVAFALKSGSTNHFSLWVHLLGFSAAQQWLRAVEQSSRAKVLSLTCGANCVCLASAVQAFATQSQSLHSASTASGAFRGPQGPAPKVLYPPGQAMAPLPSLQQQQPMQGYQAHLTGAQGQAGGRPSMTAYAPTSLAGQGQGSAWGCQQSNGMQLNGGNQGQQGGTNSPFAANSAVAFGQQSVSTQLALQGVTHSPLALLKSLQVCMGAWAC